MSRKSKESDANEQHARQLVRVNNAIDALIEMFEVTDESTIMHEGNRVSIHIDLVERIIARLDTKES